MYEITVKHHFSGAHFLRGYRGKCENLHGHNWTVEVTLVGETLDDNGILYDFCLLKDDISKIIDRLDHTLLNDLPEFTSQNPSSELIAKFVFEKMNESIKREGVTVSRVGVWESDSSHAVYHK